MELSLDWFQGKFTGPPHIWLEKQRFPVTVAFPLNGHWRRNKFRRIFGG